MAMTLVIGARLYPVAPETLAAASALYCAKRDASKLPSSRMPPAFIMRDGRTIGHMSYNGRVWEGSPRQWSPETKPLYDNR